MSGNEAADYTKRDAALMLFGAVATAWTVLVLWQWGMTAAEYGFRSPALIKAEANTPLRVLPDDPGGETVPNANREFQLAITARDPSSVWQNSRAIGSGPTPQVVSGPLNQAADAADETEGSAAVDTPAESSLIRPLPEEAAVESADGIDADPVVIPDAFLRPPQRRPGA